MSTLFERGDQHGKAVALSMPGMWVSRRISRWAGLYEPRRSRRGAGNYGPKAQAALVAHPEAPVEVEYALYQCGACGTLESRLAVMVKAPVRVAVRQRCDCGKIMHRIRAGNAIFCPRCKQPLEKTDVVAVTMWD